VESNAGNLVVVDLRVIVPHMNESMNDFYRAPSAPVSDPELQRPPFTFSLGDCFAGKERLWKAVWVLGGIVGFVTAFIAMLLRSEVPQPQRAFILNLAASTPIYVLWCVSLWRCAWRSSHWVWGVLARISAVSIVCIVAVRIVSAFNIT
jgi:hypothetical protein